MIILLAIFLNSIIVLFACYTGYRMAGGKEIDLIPQKLKAIIRTEEQEADFERKLKERK